MVHVMAVSLPDRADNSAAAAGRASRDHPNRGTGGLLLAGWCAVAVGIAAGDGRGPWPLPFIVIGWAAVLLAVGTQAGRGALANRIRARMSRTPTTAWTALAVVVAVGVALRPRYYAAGPWADISDLLGVTAGLLTAASVLRWQHPPAGPRWAAARWLVSPACFWPIVGLATGAGIAMVLAAPQPRIDVFHLLQVSGRGLVEGSDMYRQQWARSRADYPVRGLFDVYPYLPGTTLALVPFRLGLGDVRYGLLLALVLAAMTVRRAARGALTEGVGIPAALPLVILVFPGSMYALQQSWTEPLLIACLAGMVWAVASGRTRWAIVLFAAALASKQHMALLVPIAAAWPAFGPRRAFASVGIAVAVVLPWVLAGPSDFWHDAVMTNLRYPVRGDSLSVPGVLAHAGVTTGFAPMAVALGFAYWLAWRVRVDAAGFCAGAAAVLLTLDVMNKQSYFNHYTLPMALLVMTLALGSGSGSELGTGTGG